MIKRILGGILVGIGIPMTTVALIVLVFAIPSNFHVEGEGILWGARLVETYSLADEILGVLFGISLALSSIPLFLSPRRRTVKISEAPVESVSPTEEPHMPLRQPHPADQGEFVLYTSLLDVSRLGAYSRDTAKALAALRPGEPLVCRSVKESGAHGKIGQSELLQVSTMDGKYLGYMDTAFVRALRGRYPHHRMGLSVAKVSGGGNMPFACEVRVGVYRN